MKDLASTKLNNTTGEIVGADADVFTREDFNIVEKEEEVEGLVDLGRLEGMLTSISDSSSIKTMNPRNFRDQLQVEDDGSNQFLWIYVLGVGWKKTSLS